ATWYTAFPSTWKRSAGRPSAKSPPSSIRRPERWPTTCGTGSRASQSPPGRPIPRAACGSGRGGTRDGRRRWSSRPSPLSPSLPLGAGGRALGNRIAATAKAKAELSRIEKERAEADAEHARALNAEAEARAEVEHREAQTQKREALIQQVQRVRLTNQIVGW